MTCHGHVWYEECTCPGRVTVGKERKGKEGKWKGIDRSLLEFPQTFVTFREGSAFRQNGFRFPASEPPRDALEMLQDNGPTERSSDFFQEKEKTGFLAGI